MPSCNWIKEVALLDGHPIDAAAEKCGGAQHRSDGQDATLDSRSS
jgi:hypothetical protein